MAQQVERKYVVLEGNVFMETEGCVMQLITLEEAALLGFTGDHVLWSPAFFYNKI